MAHKTHPFTREQLERIAQTHPTPFHIYDEKAIRENVRALLKAFSWAPEFKEYFAVKATPNPYLLKIFRSMGLGTDCSSLAELVMAERVGLRGEEIMFTSNDTPATEYRKARELGAIINLDDITHLPYLEEHAGLPELLCMRYNPGPLKEGNVIIGDPQEAKYGFTRQQLFEGYRIAREKGIERFGIHTMVASNELDAAYFVETAEILFRLVADISKELGIRFEFVNLGGGIGIPYRPEQEPVDIERMSAGIRDRYESIIKPAGAHPLKIYLECGRMVTGPYGYLVSRVLHVKDTYKRFVGLDASMANLMRPAIYGAYHHLSVAGKEEAPHGTVCDVTGSLCENNDKFAIDRPLPETVPGDLVIIHDTGAHGHAMGFNYNGKLRSAELLLRDGGEVMQIRRAETVEDYFATLDLGGLANFDV
jgi:diaminopimelate decarboxylase